MTVHLPLFPTSPLACCAGHRAARSLADARTGAEVLEARGLAAIAYDAAKSAGRFAQATAAHHDVGAPFIWCRRRCVILSHADILLADEYDAAQARGEVEGLGGQG